MAPNHKIPRHIFLVFPGLFVGIFFRFPSVASFGTVQLCTQANWMPASASLADAAKMLLMLSIDDAQLVALVISIKATVGVAL